RHPLKDEWWDSIYLARDEVAGRVAVPTMIIASWQVINRVYHSERYPSKILFPVIPAAAAQAPAPEYSALRAQPFRKGTEFVPGGLPIRYNQLLLFGY
ncbi:hypothetical protein NKH96_31115, partial [Mesorhizobium sp. M0843]